MAVDDVTKRLHHRAAESAVENTHLVNKLKQGIFLSSVAGMSIIFGFGLTVALTKKKDPTLFTKSLMGSKQLPESGGSFALRALAWGTFYSVSGFSLFCWGVWKLSGAKNMQEFTAKIQTKMPVVPKKPSEEQGRSDFTTVRELVNYIIEEDEKNKHKKKT